MSPLSILLRPLASFLLVLVIAVPTFCEDAMFRGNPQHTGVYEAVGIPNFSRVKWKFHTGGLVISSPAVADGLVYFGSADENLYAVDAESGAQKWKFEAKGRVVSSPAVSDGVVFFGAYNGSFYAVDAVTGKQRWNFKTGGERRFAAKHLHGAEPRGEIQPDPFDCFLSSPVVLNGVVYFGSGDGNIYALSAKSGVLKWKFKTGNVVHASPAIADGVVYVGSWDSYFYAINAVTGREQWRFKTGDDPDTHNQVGIQSSAAVLDGVVYFGCRDSHLYALNAKTGLKKWAFSTKGSWVIGSPAVQDGKVYFPTSDSSLLFAADAKSGKLLYSVSFNKWYIFSSPAIAGNMLYVGSEQGKLLTVDLSSQKAGWTFETEASQKNGLAYTSQDGTPNGDTLYRSSFYDDMVSGVDRLMSMGSILSSPVVVGKVIYVGSADGNMYALL